MESAPAPWRLRLGRPGLAVLAPGLLVTATLLAVFWTARLVQLGLAVALGFTSQVAAWRWLLLPGILAEDLLAAAVLGGLAGGLAAVQQRLGLPSWLRLLPGLLVLLPTTLLTLVGVALYRLYQTPLTRGQLEVMGTLTDFRSSILENLTPLNVGVGLLLFGVALGGVPGLGRLLTRWRARRAGRRPWPVLVALLVIVLCYLALPTGGLLGLQKNPVLALVLAGGGRGPDDSPPLALGPDPRFDLARVFDPADPAAEALTDLVDLAARPAGPLNVLLYVGESWAASQHCLVDGPAEACPRLQALRPHSLLFDNYYCLTPVSMKSLFSLTCSLHPMPIPQAETYVHGNIDCRSLSEILKDRGYATVGLHAGHFHYSDKRRYLDHRKFDVLRDGDTLRARKQYPINGWGADDRAMRDDFLGWLDGLPAGTPWHALLIPVTPHYPYQPIPGAPQPFGNATLKDRYLNHMVLQDQILGDIWEELQRRGQLEQTLIVLVGDHGQAFDEHAGNVMHGSYLYEESVRVPLILLHPRLFRGAVSHRIGNHLDLVPTVLELLQLPPEPRHEGRSLLAGYRPTRQHFFTKYAHYQLGIRDGRYKFIYDKDKGTDELFDLHVDRAERRNLASSRPEMVRRYRELANAWEGFYTELIPNYEFYRLPTRACRGQDVCFLDELEPTFTHGKAEPRRSALKQKLQIDGRVFGRGWGVEAPSILRFSVAGLGYQWLEGTVGHDDDIYAGQLGETVSAQVFVDEQLVFSTGKMKKGDPALTFRVPVVGARTVELFGHDMDGIGYRDTIDWGDLRLTR